MRCFRSHLERQSPPKYMGRTGDGVVSTETRVMTFYLIWCYDPENGDCQEKKSIPFHRISRCFSLTAVIDKESPWCLVICDNSHLSSTPRHDSTFHLSLRGVNRHSHLKANLKVENAEMRNNKMRFAWQLKNYLETEITKISILRKGSQRKRIKYLQKISRRKKKNNNNISSCHIWIISCK